MPRPNTPSDHVGEHHGDMRIVGMGGQRLMPSGARVRQWVVQCKCGRTKEMPYAQFAQNDRCGCGRNSSWSVTHGHCVQKPSPEYRVWASMITRCTNPRRDSYARYGGRGIKVCDRWLHSFADFLADVGPRPSLDYTLDRIDNDGNYEPGNVRWASSTVQRANRRRSVLLTINGETMCAMDWSRRSGVHWRTLYRRLDEGWSPERAVFTPSRRPGAGPAVPRGPQR